MPTVSKRSAGGKPSKAYPLTPHRTGRWCKKVKGHMYYFGALDDPDGALREWNDRKESILLGDELKAKHQRPPRHGYSVKDACDSYLTTKKARVESGEISARHFRDLKDTATLLADALGRERGLATLGPIHFDRLRSKLAERYGAVALKNCIIRIRSIFRAAHLNRLIEQPVNFGDKFQLPDRSIIRRQRAERGERLYTAEQLRQLIDGAGVQLKAMILLGVNCGLGNSDCGKLEMRHLDLANGWLHFPRPKTGVDRKCKLWSETVKALQAAINHRPTPRDEAHAERVFLTQSGQPWADDRPNSPISQQFRKLLKKLKLYRAGLSFYTLRHQFETIAGGCRDQVAVNHVMGHVDSSMAAAYRERIDDDRLEAVADWVHAWLYDDEQVASTPARGGLRVVG